MQQQHLSYQFMKKFKNEKNHYLYNSMTKVSRNCNFFIFSHFFVSSCLNANMQHLVASALTLDDSISYIHKIFFFYKISNKDNKEELLTACFSYKFLNESFSFFVLMFLKFVYVARHYDATYCFYFF